jgi:hypothetical protein
LLISICVCDKYFKCVFVLKKLFENFEDEFLILFMCYIAFPLLLKLFCNCLQNYIICTVKIQVIEIKL